MTMHTGVSTIRPTRKGMIAASSHWMWMGLADGRTRKGTFWLNM